MRELSLYSGIGGGLLGSLLLGWRPIGYVENNEYCQKIITQRIKDGILPNAPIFGDIRAFISEGYADSYKGMVDVVTAGFPCQPFSVAGKRKGEMDECNMWPDTIEVVRRVRPRFALLENVPGLLGSGYFGSILRDISESGYDARWKVISAAELGAPHRRDRVWIVACNTNGKHENKVEKIQGQKQITDPQRVCKDVADAKRTRQYPQHKSEAGQAARRDTWWSKDPADDPESGVGRVAHGVASRVDRLKALGNGQVPAVVKAAWEILTDETP